MPFGTGKIPSEVLIRSVFRYKGTYDSSVLVGSSIGEDAALVSLRDKVLVFTTDPVTGTASDIGFLSVHINANDIACRGAKPRWFLCDLLLPESANARLIETVMKQVDEAARRLKVAVVGGHTEVTPRLKKPILVGCMVGVVDKGKYVTSHGAHPNDHIIMTKSAGIEGTALLAMDFAHQLRLNSKLIAKARAMRRSISVVRDAMIAVETGGVHAMHDPTEGGLLQGTWEIAEASKVGFEVYESSIPICEETKQVCTSLHVNPLRLMSSGSLLIAADRRKSGQIVNRLRQHHIRAQIIGKFTNARSGRRLKQVNGTTLQIDPSERDELYRVIERCARR